LFVATLLINKAAAQDDDQEDDDNDEVGEEAGDEPDSSLLEELPNAVNFAKNDEEEHLKNFKKIAASLKVYEDEYSACLKEIPDDDFNQDKIDECVGNNFIKVVLDIKYETLKVMARAESKVRGNFIKLCYTPAGKSESYSVGCDYMEQDTLLMLWNGMDFNELLEINREKYLTEYGKIPKADFIALLESLNSFAKEFFELIDEIDNHKEVTVLRLKTLIDDRRKLIEEDLKISGAIPPGKITHTISISEDSAQSGIQTGNMPGDPLMIENDILPNRRTRQVHHVDRGLNNNANQSQKVPIRINRGGVGRSTFTRFRPAQGYVSKSPIESRMATRANPHRAFNAGNRYTGLHYQQPNRRLVSPTAGIKSNAFRANMINKLSPTMRAQANIPFKNVHTAHFARHRHL
jgi:hypothetical protein